MKNTIKKLFCISLSTLSLSACYVVPSVNVEESSLNMHPTTITMTETDEVKPVINETTSVSSNCVTDFTSETIAVQSAINAEPLVNATLTTSAAVSDYASISEQKVNTVKSPDDFYINFKPLLFNIFVGNDISCSSEIYAEQIKRIDEEIDYIYGENYNPCLEAKLLICALLSNQNIEYKYKKWLFHMVEYFDDNAYIQREEIYDKLQTMQIEVIVFYEENEKSMYGAEYRVDENKIIFYIIETDEYKECYYNSYAYEETCLPYVDNDIHYLLKHEIFHNTVSNKVDNLGSFLNEGMTVFLETEYNMGDINYIEDQRILYLKMLIEIIGKDKILEAYSKSNWSVIEEALLAIDPDTSKPVRIYELMIEWDSEWANSHYDYYLVSEPTVDIRTEMSQILTEYYNKVYPYTYENSLYAKYNDMFMGRTDYLYDDMAKA